MGDALVRFLLLPGVPPGGRRKWLVIVWDNLDWLFNSEHSVSGDSSIFCAIFALSYCENFDFDGFCVLTF